MWASITLLLLAGKLFYLIKWNQRLHWLVTTVGSVETCIACVVGISDSICESMNSLLEGYVSCSVLGGLRGAWYVWQHRAHF